MLSNICHAKGFVWLFLAALLAIGFVACNTNEGNKEGLDADDFSSISLELQAPEDFAEAFCTRIEVDGEEFDTIVFEKNSLAHTQVVEGVVSNIPVGTDRTVRVGIFHGRPCGDIDEADWSGKATGVVVRTDEVTLVDITLVRNKNASGTGTIIVRTGAAIEVRPLHGEVVMEDATPLPGVSCAISNNAQDLGTVVSGSAVDDYGVLDADVEVTQDVVELQVFCRLRGFEPSRARARLVLDPNNPFFGTFVTTVIMKRGVDTKITLVTESAVAFEVNLPLIRLAEVTAGEFGPFMRVENKSNMYNMVRPGEENTSLPEVPMYSAVIAVPFDNEVRVQITRGQTTEDKVRLYPVQEINLDDGSPTKPFFFDEKYYLEKGFVRVDDYRLDSLGGTDEYNLKVIKFPLVDYDPKSQLMTSYSSLKAEITFEGKTKIFRRLRTAKDYELDPVDQILNDSASDASGSRALNWQLANELIEAYEILPIFYGAQFVIVTHPDFETEALALRAHKIALGISTIVVSTDSLAGSTAADIKSYLQNAYDNWFIRPKWVLLMGDTDYIPTHVTGGYAGDVYFGQFEDFEDDLRMPVFGIGRFPVKTNDEAQTMVDKIIEYENNPPASPLVNSFYNSLTFAAYFQDDEPDGQSNRGYSETTEEIRSHLVGESMDVTRVYITEADVYPTLWYDGTPVPWYLQKPTFPWDGDTTDIIAEVNNGNTIMYHRDHGGSSGWIDPSLNNGDLASISVTNNEFPSVFGINCQSARYDMVSQSFAENFVLKSDGALGYIGASRNSPTQANHDLARGLFDAMWPDFKPAFGSTSAIKRLGDVLNAGKDYMATMGGHNDSTDRVQIKMYNLLGDPTCETKVKKPFILEIGPFYEGPIIYIYMGCPMKELEKGVPEGPIFATVLGPKGEILGRQAATQAATCQDGDLMLAVEVGAGLDPNDLKVAVAGPEIEPAIVSVR